PCPIGSSTSRSGDPPILLSPEVTLSKFPPKGTIWRLNTSPPTQESARLSPPNCPCQREIHERTQLTLLFSTKIPNSNTRFSMILPRKSLFLPPKSLGRAAPTLAATIDQRLV